VSAAYLVHGDDPALVGLALAELLGRLGVEPGASVELEEHRGPGPDEPPPLAPVLDGCRTPPFFAPRRVVVLRDAERLDAAGAEALRSCLPEIPPTTVLVVCAVTGAAGLRGHLGALATAVGAVGEVVEATPRGTRDRRRWFEEHLAHAEVRLEPAAAERLRAHLGDDLSRLPGLLEVLVAAYGPGARVSVGRLEPFLGEQGAAPPFELTDAIDRGDVAGALAALQRLLGPGGRHPLQVVAVLHRHLEAMLRLDGADVRDETAAAALLGTSPYPARKALLGARRFGHEALGRALVLLADADADLRGGSALPAPALLEILVARLARLASGSPRVVAARRRASR
jgi:DNA polymerase-3 subunit delta